MHNIAWADQDWIGLMIFKNFADQDWIGFNFIGSGLDSDGKILKSAHLCSVHAYMAWSQKFRKSDISLDTRLKKYANVSQVIGVTFFTPAPVPKKVTPAPELIRNLHSDSCLHSESLKAEFIFPHEAK